MDENPDFTKQLAIDIDGEPRILELYKVSDQSASPWCGFCYRRDWIVKYGTNPTTGDAFTGGWNDDFTEWSDDVVFPSGGTDPIYFSDWEWMFDIFTKALSEQQVEGGYVTQLFYKGYYEGGDLVSSFNAAPMFFLDQDGVYQFGGDDDTFRTYVSTMTDWYAKGWLMPGFDEEVNPAFFMLDAANLYSGKVGLWYGMNSMLGKGMDNGTPLTENICVYGCPDPINDPGFLL